MSLEACLPPDLRGPSTTIVPIAAGLSGAAVYRVEADGRTFVLKIASPETPPEGWRRTLHVQQLAANAGLAPAVVHVDEERRAILSAFVVDRSFPAFYGNPATHDAALVELGRTVRRLHALPLPPGAKVNDPRGFLATIASGLAAGFTVPPFVVDAIEKTLAEEPPPRERVLVLSHNDINPTNLVYDGRNILLLDWDTAGQNDPFHDLAVVSMFLRMDEGTCAKLLAAYDDAPITSLPARFAYSRRLAAVLCGALFLHLARTSGHGGAKGDETLASAPSLGDLYQRIRTGVLNVASAEGQWSFGLALVKERAAHRASD